MPELNNSHEGETVANGVHSVVDEEEVSLSDTSLSTDSSGDEEYENSDVDVEAEEDVDVFKDAPPLQQQQQDFGGLAGEKAKSIRRSVSDIAAQDSRCRRERHTVAEGHHGASADTHAPKLDCFKLDKKSRSRRGYLDDIPTSSLDNGKIPRSMALTMAKQHVQLARSCLELLNEKDRQDALRRRNLRLAMLNDGTKKNSPGAIEEDDNDDDCPLLTMIKSGPLYKLHIKGGRKTSKSLNRKMSWQMKNEEKDTKNVSITERLLTRWKPKFVEVRKGMFSYYDNSRKSGLGLVRKNVALQASTCVCQAVDYFGTGDIAHDVDDEEPLPPSGQLYPFELKIKGLPTRLFATGTEAGRQAWIQSICIAMVGKGDGTVAHKYEEMDNATNQVKKFADYAESADNATTAASYTETFLKPLWGSSISVPIKAISPMLTKTVADHQKLAKCDHVNMHEDQETFWHMLKQYNFAVNEEKFRGQSIHGPERTFGALMRRILHFDKISLQDDPSQNSDGREMMAARYARDILKASAMKYKGRVASLDMAVKALCKNEKELSLVRNIAEQSKQNTTSPSANEAPTITICLNKINPNNTSNAGQQRSSAHDRRAWLHVRHNKYKRPKPYFVVLSVGVLCFYKEAKPKPHQLIEQILLVGARIGFYTAEEHGSQGGLGCSSHHTTESVGKNEEGSLISSDRNSHQSSDAPQSLKQPKYIIYVVSNGKKAGERHLCFTDFEKFSEWRDVLMLAVKTCHSPLLGAQNPTSAGEFASKEQRLLSTMTSQTPAGDTFETDSNGIAWVTGSSQHRSNIGDSPSSMDVSSRTLTTLSRRSSDSLSLMPSFSLLGQLAATRIIEDNSIVHSIRAISGVTKKFTGTSNSGKSDSRSDSGEMLDDDVESNSVKPSVELKIKFATFHYLLMKNDPKDVVATIRTTWSQKCELSFGGNLELTKEQEMVKIDTLRGEVEPNTFEQMFDTEKKARKRPTI